MKTLDQLRFPIGDFEMTVAPSPQQIATWIETIKSFPHLLKTEVENLNAAELALQYRPEGWSIQQVVHHCADSHMNAFIRFKLTLTESNPSIKPYDEAAWALQSDTLAMDIAYSLSILEGLHARWVQLLTSLTEADLQKTYYHPEHDLSFTLLHALDNYQWHCRHHLAHVQQAKQRGA